MSGNTIGLKSSEPGLFAWKEAWFSVLGVPVTRQVDSVGKLRQLSELVDDREDRFVTCDLEASAGAEIVLDVHDNKRVHAGR